PGIFGSRKRLGLNTVLVRVGARVDQRKRRSAQGPRPPAQLQSLGLRNEGSPAEREVVGNVEARRPLILFEVHVVADLVVAAGSTVARRVAMRSPVGVGHLRAVVMTETL